MAMSPGKGSNNKQRTMVIGAIFVVIVGIVIWQVMQLSGGGSSTPPPAPAAVPKPPAQANAAAPSPAPAGAPAPGAVAGTTAAMAMQPAAPTVSQKNVLVIPDESESIENQKKVQKEYLDALNKLQILKVKREIEETNQAIGAARLATVTENNNITEMLTKSAPPPVPEGTYSNSLIAPVPAGSAVNVQAINNPSPPQTAPTPPPPPPQAPQMPESPYVVISVAMQFDKWSAVMGTTSGAQGSLYNVKIGDALPDGSIVKSINRDGVTLERNGQKRKVTIVSSI